MTNVGPMEILVVLIIVLVVFGPKRLPEFGRSLGEGIRGFREALTGEDDESKTATAVRVTASGEKAGMNASTKEPVNEPGR